MTLSRLSADDLEVIHREGICLKPGFFSTNDIRELHDAALRMRDYSVSHSIDARRWILVSPVDAVRKSFKPGGYRAIRHLSRVAEGCGFRDFASRYLSGEVHLDHVMSIESPRSSEAITPWHTDANSDDLHEDFFSLKFFIYLNDISVANGAFAYVRGSHRLVTILRRGIFQRKIPFVRTASPRELIDATEERKVREYLSQEMNPGEIEETLSHLRVLRDDLPGDASHDLAGVAGTLLVFDDRGVHRGGVPTHGHRSILRYNYVLNAYNALGGKRAKANQMVKQLLPSAIRKNW